MVITRILIYEEEYIQYPLYYWLPITLPGLPTLCFQKVWKRREVFNVCVTAGPRPAQAQEEPARRGPIPRFCVKTEIFCKIE